MSTANKSVTFNAHNCKACWKCLNVCPKNIIGKVSFLWHKHAKVSKPEQCIGCLACVGACKYGAFTKPC